MLISEINIEEEKKRTLCVCVCLPDKKKHTFGMCLCAECADNGKWKNKKRKENRILYSSI